MTAIGPTTVTPYRLPTEPGARLDGTRKQAIETGRTRLIVTAVTFALAFAVVGARLLDLALVRAGGEARVAQTQTGAGGTAGRADVLDRNGVVLATSLPTVSLYADPRQVLDPEEAAERLSEALPELDPAETLFRLRAGASFVWLRRNLTPQQHYAVNRLGIPGLNFLVGERRVYPHGREAAHVLGVTDVDGVGLAGLERAFDAELRAGRGPLRTSLDIRVQAMLRDEVATAVERFEAIGGAGVVMDVNSAEIVATVSLPDFDPNQPASARGEAAFNRVTKGVYEMGSTFKLFTAAMALDSGAVAIDGGYDASRPIRVARFTITDYHAKNRWLSVPEIMIYSSNIAAAKMALDVGIETQRAYLRRFGLIDPAPVELPEVGAPLIPAPWRPINSMTIAYGHGIAVSPLQMAAGVAALANGGVLRPATLLRQAPRMPRPGERVLSARTSGQMRELMRLVVQKGTGRKAEAEGYRVGGKTGTAEKQVGGRYAARALISSFVGVFPVDAPRYAVLVLLDEPKGNKSTQNYATGGWVAAPAVARLVSRIAPLLGIAPVLEDDKGSPRPGETLLVAAKAEGRRLETR